MSNTEKRADEIISDTMRELYDSIEKKEKKQKEPVVEVEETETTETTEEEEAEFEEIEEFEEEAEEEFEEEAEEEVEKSGKGFGKKLLKILGILALLLILVYVGFAVFFNSHFTFNTTINGKDYSLKNAQYVADDMDKQVQEYVLTIEESDGDSCEVKGSDISLTYVPTDEIEGLLKSQNGFLWITSLWDEPVLEAKVTVEYDDTKLTPVIEALPCLVPENQVASENARPEFKETQFEVKEEVIGTQIDVNIFNTAVREAIADFEETLVLADTGCYLLPKYVSTSEEVIAACDKMNSWLGAEITYDLHPETVVVDASVIATWLTVNDKMEVKFSDKKMKEYLKEFAKKYDTWGKDRKFKAADGDTVTVSGGAYGWLIDEKSEFKQLKKDIKSGEKISREPVYYSYGKAAEHTETDWGDTYAEVDLTDQKMYFIKDGKVVLSSDVVTGNPNRGNATPQGMYSLTYKTKNAVLRGRRDENGVPEYETPVAYWMPFNGGIGFHDATWQSSFGGSRYRTNGSHGCINMPKSKAAELYKLIPEKCPVICHY